MLQFKILPALFLSLFSAQAAELQVALDSGGMPRCLSEAGGNRALVLNWEPKELYRRDVRVFVADSPRTCSRWESFLRFKDLDKGSVLPAEASEFEGIRLDERTLRALAQVRFGGSVYREEATAAEFMTRHYLEPFDLETNRQWTARYGDGFVSELYSDWLRRRPSNAVFQAGVLQRADAASPVRAPWLEPSFGSKRVVLYVKGLAHETKLAYRFGALVDDLLAMGVPMVTAPTAGYGDMWKNAESVKVTLRSLLDQGKDVVIVSLSKGSTETAIALMDMQEEIDAPPARGRGVVKAWLSFSGVFQGSFFADYGTAFPLWLFVKAKMLKDLRDEGLDIDDLSGVPQLASKPMEKLLPDLRTRLPRTVLCYNVIGTLSGDGLAADESIRKGQDEIIRKRIRTGFGANDGFMEYPNNVLQEEWLPPGHLKILNVHGSHAVNEGNFGGWRVADPEGRWRLLSGLMGTILSEVDGRDP